MPFYISRWKYLIDYSYRLDQNGQGIPINAQQFYSLEFTMSFYNYINSMLMFQDQFREIVGPFHLEVRV